METVIVRSRKESDSISAYLFATDVDKSTTLNLTPKDQHRLSEAVKEWLVGCHIRHDINWEELFWAGDGGFLLMSRKTNDAETVLKAALSFVKYSKSWLHTPGNPFGRVRLRCLLTVIDEAIIRPGSAGTAASFELNLALKNERNVTLPDSLAITNQFIRCLRPVHPDKKRRKDATDIDVGRETLTRILSPDVVAMVDRSRTWIEVGVQVAARGPKSVAAEWAALCFPSIRNDRMHLRYHDSRSIILDMLAASLDQPVGFFRVREKQSEAMQLLCSELAVHLGSETDYCGAAVRVTYFRYTTSPTNKHTEFQTIRGWFNRDVWKPSDDEAEFPPGDSSAGRALSSGSVDIVFSASSPRFNKTSARAKCIASMLSVPVAPKGHESHLVFGVLCVDFTEEVFSASTFARLDMPEEKLLEVGQERLAEEFRNPASLNDTLVVESQLYAQQLAELELVCRLSR